MALSAAIVLAAGEGTRMRSNKPKVLHAFAGKTFLNRVMDSVAALNPDTLAVVVHFQAERVAEAARSYDEQVTIVNQDDIPGTGRAVQCAMAQLTEAGKVDGPVLIAASDMPLLDSETLHRLVEFHTASGNGATVLTTILDDPTGYGRIIRDREGNVLRIVEQKDANRSELAVQEVNTSVYVFEASVLTEAIAGLKSNNAQGEFYLSDALETAKAAGKVGAFAAPDPLTVEGVNDRVQLAALSKTYNLTGMRVSFALGNREVISRFRAFRSQIDYGMFYPIMAGAAAALNGPQDVVESNRTGYMARRDALCGGLRSIGWNVPDAQGTMFVWAKIPERFASSVDFAIELMEKTGVIVVPGSAFGEQGEGYVRMALVVPPERMAEAVRRIDESGIVKE